MSNVIPSAPLTNEQIQFFNDNGYLHLKSIVPDTLLRNTQVPMDKWVNQIISKWLKAGLINRDFHEDPFESRLINAWKSANYPPCNPMLTSEIFSKEIFDFLRSPVLYDVASSLLNTENLNALWAFTCRPKLPPRPPGIDRPWIEVDVPWHQDAQYINDSTPSFLIMWIPFVDVDLKRSPMQLAAGHHADGLYKNHKSGGYCSIHSEETNHLTNLKTMTMKRGDLLAMHALLPHRSLENQTNLVRWSMDVRYANIDKISSSTTLPGFISSHQDKSKIETSFDECNKKFHAEYKKLTI